MELPKESAQTRVSKFNSSAEGATKDWTINLCLLFSLGSKSKGCRLTKKRKFKSKQCRLHKKTTLSLKMRYRYGINIVSLNYLRFQRLHLFPKFPNWDGRSISWAQSF